MLNDLRIRVSTAIAVLALSCTFAWGQEVATAIPPPSLDNPRAPGELQKAILAGGCYWGTQGIFEHVGGVRHVAAGYSAGRNDNDGGAETVMITFDPDVISYGQILQIFFSVVHDPTQLNRQGPDEGAAYRSDVFYQDDSQKRIAEAYVAQLDQAKVFPAALVTRVDAFKDFHQVDLNQQDFMIKNPHSKYIVENDLPKLANLKRLFPTAYRESPVTFRD